MSYTWNTQQSIQQSFDEKTPLWSVTSFLFITPPILPKKMPSGILGQSARCQPQTHKTLKTIFFFKNFFEDNPSLIPALFEVFWKIFTQLYREATQLIFAVIIFWRMASEEHLLSFFPALLAQHQNRITVIFSKKNFYFSFFHDLGMKRFSLYTRKNKKNPFLFYKLLQWKNSNFFFLLYWT